MGLMPEFLKKVFQRTKPIDRRRSPRQDPYKDIAISLIYEDGGNKKAIPLLIMNVSRTGLLVDTNEVRVLPKTPAQVKFKHPSQAEPLLIGVDIVRTFRRRSMPFYYCGINFKDQNEKNVQLLQDLVLKAQQ